MSFFHSIFYDTSAWIALYAEDDISHQVVVEQHALVAREKRLVVTSNLVFAETHAFFCDTPKAALKIGEVIRSSRVVSYQKVTSDDEEKAWGILKKYQDKTFSFCDATSFALMKRLQIPVALSFDHHFRQYGIALYGDL